MNIQLTPEQQKRADALARMTPAEWETICKKCGICCLHKTEMAISNKNDIRTIYLKRCCDKFDTKKCQCSIYKTRLTNPDCKKVDINDVLEGRILPASCGYVEYVFGPSKYPAHVDFSQVTPLNDIDDKMSAEQLVKEAIVESVLWNRCR